jgi:hypothetical protein
MLRGAQQRLTIPDEVGDVRPSSWHRKDYLTLL